MSDGPFDQDIIDRFRNCERPYVGVTYVRIAQSIRDAERAERDRLRAVVEVVRNWRAAQPGHESAVAIQAMNEAFAQLDGSGVMGGDARKGTDDGTGVVVADLRDDRQPGVRGDALAPPVDAEAERDRLQAVVEALRRHRVADAHLMALVDGDEDEQRAADSKAAGYWQEVVEALAALDRTGIIGAGSEADDPEIAEQLRQFHDDTDDLYREAQRESYVQAEEGAIPVFPLLANLMDLRDFVRHPEIVGPRLIEWWNRALPAGLGPWLETVVHEALDAAEHESSAGGAGSASPDPTPTTGAPGVASPGAPSTCSRCGGGDPLCYLCSAPSSIGPGSEADGG